MRTGAYHYLLVCASSYIVSAVIVTHIRNQCLLGRYTKNSRPLFLTEAGFEKLRENDSSAVDAFRLHTDSILK